jgi:hypothetical protein
MSNGCMCVFVVAVLHKPENCASGIVAVFGCTALAITSTRIVNAVTLRSIHKTNYYMTGTSLFLS